LSYDLKFAKGENDKIFIDNEITIAVKKKIIPLFSWNCFRILWRNKRKGFVFNNPNATRTCGCGESFSL
jgi:iron-sulfur cluster assembly protein